MKRSATSSAGLPLPPSRRRKRDGVGRAEGERERQISRLRPPTLGWVSGSSPQRTPFPLARLGPTTPRDEGGGERPQGPQAHLLRGNCRHHPPGPGLPGSNRLSIQLPVARSPGRARPTSPGRSPGLDFATYPTPEGEPGELRGRGQPSPGGREEEARRPPATGRRGGKGVRARGSRQPASRGRPPTPAPHALPSQVAHSQVQAGAPWPSRVLGTSETRKKTRHGRGHPQDPRRWRWGP